MNTKTKDKLEIKAAKLIFEVILGRKPKKEKKFVRDEKLLFVVQIFVRHLIDIIPSIEPKFRRKKS